MESFRSGREEKEILDGEKKCDKNKERKWSEMVERLQKGEREIMWCQSGRLFLDVGCYHYYTGLSDIAS